MSTITVYYCNYMGCENELSLDSGRSYYIQSDGYGLIVIEDILRKGLVVGEYGDRELTIQGSPVGEYSLTTDSGTKQVTGDLLLIANEETVTVKSFIGTPNMDITKELKGNIVRKLR